MYKAKPTKLKDGTEIFVCETSEHFEGIEADVVYVFAEDELEPNCKALVNAIEIIKNRALQEIEKSEADEYGYRLLDVEKRNYGKAYKDDGIEAFLIKKATPFSIKMDYALVWKMVSEHLEEYCNGTMNNYYEVKTVDGDINRYRITAKQIIEFSKWSVKRLKNGSTWEVEGFLDYLNKRGIEPGSPMVVEVQRLRPNYGSGYYEVSYWATDII